MLNVGKISQDMNQLYTTYECKVIFFFLRFLTAGDKWLNSVDADSFWWSSQGLSFEYAKARKFYR